MAEPDAASSGYGIGVLNRKPLLIHIIWFYDSPFPFIEALSLALGATPALLLVGNYWSILSRWKNDYYFAAFWEDYRLHRRRYPQHRIVLLANDATEEQFLRAFDMGAVLFQQNGFMHPYDIPEAKDKEFDAIYIGRIERFKRIELARNLSSCCVIFASANREYYDEIKSQISHLMFVNGDPMVHATEDFFLSKTPLLSRGGVGDWCARSRTGLCLSAEEGAMWGSGEYMVWGLPIVSTRSIGGRDEYFDDRYCLICDDNPESVAATVQEAIARQIDPGMIRSSFLAKVMARRTGLLQFIISQTAQWPGSLESFVRDWMNVGTPFLDRLRSFTASQLLEDLERGNGAYPEPDGKPGLASELVNSFREPLEARPPAADCRIPETEEAVRALRSEFAGSVEQQAKELAAVARVVEDGRAEFAEFRRATETALGVGWEEIQALQRRKKRGTLKAPWYSRLRR